MVGDYAVKAVIIAIFYLPEALIPFIVCLFVLGIGRAIFYVFSLWLPEKYHTECRSWRVCVRHFARQIAGGWSNLHRRSGVSKYESIGVPVGFPALAFVAGLILLSSA